MSERNWFRSSISYGLQLISSGLKGATLGQAEYLRGESLGSFLGQAVCKSLPATAAGVAAGALGAFVSRRARPKSRALLFAAAGGALGFAAGLAWKSRRLAATATNGALRGINATRDERWLQQNPIDYA